jgi:hypothetical protein
MLFRKCADKKNLLMGKSLPEIMIIINLRGLYIPITCNLVDSRMAFLDPEGISVTMGLYKPTAYSI